MSINNIYDNDDIDIDRMITELNNKINTQMLKLDVLKMVPTNVEVNQMIIQAEAEMGRLFIEIRKLEKQNNERLAALKEQASVQDDYWSRFILIKKPEQSGKTFIMIEEIIKELQMTTEDNTTIPINIILCDNNLLLTSQTGSRVHSSSIGECIVFSSKSEYRNTNDVLVAIEYTNCYNVICCTNGTRMDNICDIIRMINGKNYRKFHFNVWLDEADKFMSYIDEHLIPVAKQYTNVYVKFMTATADNMFEKYDSLNVFPIKDTVNQNYHGWKDNEIVMIDEKKLSCVDFVEHVLSEIAAPTNLIQPGTKWLIPGISTKKSHYRIRDICLKYNMAVITINSDGLVLTYPHTFISVTYDKNQILATRLVDIYNNHELSKYALAITGNICIGRGVTLMSEEFIFDYGILSQYANKNDASQLAGRFKGNIKSFKNYKKPKVFTTPSFNAIALEYELKSRKLAKFAYEKDNVNPTAITHKEYANCWREEGDDLSELSMTSTEKIKRTRAPKASPMDKAWKVCGSEDEARAYIQRVFNKTINKRSGDAPEEIRKRCNGQNPTVEYIIETMWGLSLHENDKTLYRVMPTNDGRWVIYWRPSKVGFVVEDCEKP
jgi:hypothetical protein